MPNLRTTRVARAARAALALPLVAGAGLVLAPAAHAELPIVPIGHDQAFVGASHGQLGTDKILMVCPGAARTGHPAGSQTVEVTRTGTTVGGFTGSRANRIVAAFSPAVSGARPIVLEAYDVVVDIPTTLTLPCTGTGTLRFTPVPAAENARPDLVTVSFEPGPALRR